MPSGPLPEHNYLVVIELDEGVEGTYQEQPHLTCPEPCGAGQTLLACTRGGPIERAQEKMLGKELETYWHRLP